MIADPARSCSTTAGFAGEVVQGKAFHWPDAPPKSAWPRPYDAEARCPEPLGERIELGHVPAERRQEHHERPAAFRDDFDGHVALLHGVRRAHGAGCLGRGRIAGLWS